MQNTHADTNPNLDRSSIDDTDKLLDNEFGERLTLAIGHESFNSFAKRANVGESLLRSYVKGTTPRLDKVIAIARAAKVSLEWLATGKGSMYKQGSTRELLSIGNGAPSHNQLSVENQGNIEKPSAISITEESQKIFLVLEKELFGENSSRHLQDLLITRMQSNSMLPTLKYGDWLFIDPVVDSNKIVEGIYAFEMDGIVLVKRFIRQPGNLLRVVSDSSIHDSFTIDLSRLSTDLSIVGKVVAVIHILIQPS